jgi:hypothetical protein
VEAGPRRFRSVELQFAAIQPYSQRYSWRCVERLKTAETAMNRTKVATMAQSRSRANRMLAVALGILAVAALSSAAQAFTFDNQTTAGASSSGSSSYTNPAQSRMLTNNGEGQRTIQQGNTTLQFGSRPSLTDERYYPEQLFQPNGRPQN